jgi:excisionase family DNA binding protein
VSDAAKEFLRIDELAALLGVPRSTLYEAIARNEIPGIRKIGKHLRASRSVVLAWFAGEGPSKRSSRRGSA